MADGAVLCGVNLNEAISIYTAVSWHSFYPWATTQSTRRFGGSTAVMYDGDGHSFVGLLRAAVNTARTWGVGQRYLGMIRRLEHETNRPEDYIISWHCTGARDQGLMRVISWCSDCGECGVSHCENVHSLCTNETRVLLEKSYKPEAPPYIKTAALW